MTHFLPYLVLAALSGDPVGATATLLDGRTVTGEVVAWSDGGVEMTTDHGKESLKSGELLNIRWPAPPDRELAASTSVELVDGTRIVFSEFAVASRQATVAGPYAAAPVVVPTELIRLVELQPPSEATKSAWEELQRKELVGDVLMVAKRDGESMDYLTGVVGDLTTDQADFEWDGERVAVKRTKIAAIAYYHAKERSLPEAVCTLTMADGSQIAAQKLSVRDGRLIVGTPAGVELEASLDQVVQADFSTGKLSYLSDLKPTEVRWTPRVAMPPGAQLIGAYGLPRSDTSYSGSALSLLWKDDVLPAKRDIRTYEKGLAIRSRTELSYRVPPGMRRFIAIAGIDPVAAGQGHVVLEVLADDQLLWQGPIEGQQPPVELDLELGKARRLLLRVDYGENLDYGDRLHLVEARVTK